MVIIPGLGQVAPAALADFFGFLGLTVTWWRIVIGVIRTGRRAILAGAAAGSGDLK